MNHDLFVQYAPVVNAYLSGNTDTKAKTWNQVVEAFYIINTDMRFNEYADLANTFKYSSKPSYLCILGSDVLQYIGREKTTKQYLASKQFKEYVDYVSDTTGIRMTFTTFRCLLFERPEHVPAFDFADKIYQMFRRYETKMIARAKIATHWTVIERVAEFSKSMELHKPKKNVQLMNEQPKVFCIVKGTFKSVRSRLASYVKKTNAEGDHLYSQDPLVPIYETVLSSADKEIALLVEYINNTHTVPYRQALLEEAGEKAKINKMKYNVKITKSTILVDPSQTTYTATMIKSDINHIREGVKQGTITEEEVTYYDTATRTGIKRYTETEGAYFDDFNKIALVPTYEDLALVSYSQDYLELSNTPVALESEAGESEAETVMSAKTEYKPKNRSSKKKPLEKLVEEEAKTTKEPPKQLGLNPPYESDSYDSD